MALLFTKFYNDKVMDDMLCSSDKLWEYEAVNTNSMCAVTCAGDSSCDSYHYSDAAKVCDGYSKKDLEPTSCEIQVGIYIL